MLKKALLVGINDYSPIGAGGPDLQGCVNDVRDMAYTLTSFGLVEATPRAMRIITDSRATRTNILNAVRWLVDDATRGDVLVFYYSGHGSWVADVDGDEIDRKDEAICPHDYARAGMITDDDLRRSLAGLPDGVHLDVIFDSCHSGTATRVLEDVPPELGIRYRFIEPPLDYAWLVRANPSIPVRRFLKARPEARHAEGRDIVIAQMNHVLWAGCRDNQTSTEAEIEGTVRGAFTYCFCRALRRAGPKISRRRLDALVGLDLRQMGYAQVPQLEGTETALNEPVFA